MTEKTAESEFGVTAIDSENDSSGGPQESAWIQVTIGPYRCLQRLGAGGMGEVYLAYDRRLERRVAVKRLRPDVERPIPRERLRREARAVARLSHPAIVQIFELLEDAGDDWIVMELVDGPSLAEVLRRLGPQPWPEVVRWAGQIAAGLICSLSVSCSTR